MLTCGNARQFRKSNRRNFPFIRSATDCFPAVRWQAFPYCLCPPPVQPVTDRWPSPFAGSPQVSDHVRRVQLRVRRGATHHQHHARPGAQKGESRVGSGVLRKEGAKESCMERSPQKG